MRTEDGALIYKCLNEEPDAFGMLVDKYKAGIYAFVYNKLGNFQDAEDVTQETFLEAFKNLRKLKNFDSFAIWLFSIASNLSKGWIRSLSKRPDREFIEDKNPKVLDDPSIELYRDSKISESLNEALESLPDIYRQVLTLHYLGGMSGLDIARSLGISHDTVRQRLLRAREQLKEEMITMMSQTFQQQKLSASFTFRVVEMLKNIRIHPNSSIKGLPWGLSLGTGLIFAILMFGQHIQINLSDIAMGLPLPSDMKVLKVGEIPFDAVKVSTITSIGNKGDGKGFAPDPKGQENAFFMAPQGDGEWTKRADMPTARVQLGAVTVNDKIYAIGGLIGANGNWTQLSTVEEYNPINDEWTKKSDMPTARHIDNGVVEVGGLIYVIGGYGNNKETLSTVEVYDPVNDKWTKRTDMPTARTLPYVGAVNGKIYVIGGSTGNINAFANTTVVEEYDPVTDKWIRKSDIPTERSTCYGAVANNKIYIFGGAKSDWGPAISTVEEYDPIADKWTEKADMPTPRDMLGIVSVNNKIYVTGGYNPATNILYPIVEIYDPEKNTWTKGENMQIARAGHICSAIKGKIYAIGGADFNKQISSVEEFDTGFIKPKSVDPSGKLPKTWGMLKAK